MLVQTRGPIVFCGWSIHEFNWFRKEMWWCGNLMDAPNYSKLMPMKSQKNSIPYFHIKGNHCLFLIIRNKKSSFLLVGKSSNFYSVDDQNFKLRLCIEQKIQKIIPCHSKEIIVLCDNNACLRILMDDNGDMTIKSQVIF